MVQVTGQVGPAFLSDGVGTQPARQSRSGEVNFSEVHGRYYEQSRRGNLFLARAAITAPIGFASSNGIGGPLLWNGSSTVNASILALSVGVTTVATAASALGFTGGTGQTTAPTSTAAIGSSGNCYLGGAAAAVSSYSTGTVGLPGAFFFPLLDVHTGTLTVDSLGLGWIDVGGLLTVPPNSWFAVSASVVASSLVAQIGVIWEEVPV